jgi:anti-anti-sigma regulatory factor
MTDLGDPPPSIDSFGHGPAGVTVRVSGELDRVGVARLRRELAGWREGGALQVWLDLSGVPGCDPSLARALAWARTQLRGHGGELIVTGAGEQVTAELATAIATLATFAGWHTDWPASLITHAETTDPPRQPP